MTSTNFLSSAVPFGVVRQINVMATEVTMVEVAKLINSYSAASDTVIGIVDWLLDQSVFQRTEYGMQLGEYDYAERTAGQLLELTEKRVLNGRSCRSGLSKTIRDAMQERRLRRESQTQIS